MTNIYEVNNPSNPMYLTLTETQSQHLFSFSSLLPWSQQCLAWTSAILFCFSVFPVTITKYLRLVLYKEKRFI
jgi:hypothetical protein